MKRTLVTCVMGLSVIGISTAALAHHSTAMYDYAKAMTLTGTVTEMQWTNPHMFIKANALDAAGKQVEWSIECGTPNINSRHGWKKSDIKPGDKVVMDIRPLRDGQPGGTLVTIKLPDGRTLNGPGGDIIAGPPGGGPPPGGFPPGGPPGAPPVPAPTR
jgi:hypothetical protein